MRSNALRLANMITDGDARRRERNRRMRDEHLSLPTIIITAHGSVQQVYAQGLPGGAKVTLHHFSNPIWIEDAQEHAELVRDQSPAPAPGDWPAS